MSTPKCNNNLNNFQDIRLIAEDEGKKGESR